MTELPNLSYLNELAGDDYEFAKQFMVVFKEEFSWEVGMYLRYIKMEKPRQASKIVGKTKYKLSMLGLNESFVLATTYERNLRDGNTHLDDKFKKILEHVNAFLAKDQV